jgi:nucleoside-diphosphate-sugar epimerase
MVYGPFEHSTTLESLNQSVLDIWLLMSGEVKKIPPASLPYFVDVRDCAEAHVRAYEGSNGGRFIPVSGPFSFEDVCRILKEDAPEYAHLVPNPGRREPSETFQINNSLSKRELHMGFDRSLRETINETVRSLEKIVRNKTRSEKL